MVTASYFGRDGHFISNENPSNRHVTTAQSEGRGWACAIKHEHTGMVSSSQRHCCRMEMLTFQGVRRFKNQWELNYIRDFVFIIYLHLRLNSFFPYMWKNRINTERVEILGTLINS